MGNAPTFLLAMDMNLSQFQDFVCQNAFASDPAVGLAAPPRPQLESFGSGQNEPPLSKSWQRAWEGRGGEGGGERDGGEGGREGGREVGR